LDEDPSEYNLILTAMLVSVVFSLMVFLWSLVIVAGQVTRQEHAFDCAAEAQIDDVEVAALPARSFG
jgi:hypothetical protein